MLFLNLKRIIKSGFVSFWRNGFVSLASILVMTVTLFTIGSIIFLQGMLGAALEQLQNKVDINVYFVTTAPEEDILALKEAIERLPEVESVEYVSRDQALEKYLANNERNQEALQAIEELDENPLGANLNIKAKETSQYAGIASFLENDPALSSTEGTPIIDNINYFQNRIMIDRLTAIIESADAFGLILSVILITASVIITFNTIRLAIYTSRDEISVMRLVGASNSYIRGPFVFEGIMYGVISAFITLTLFYPLALWLGPITESFFGNINLFTFYVDNFVRIFLIVLGSGIVLGALSSYLAVMKYLKT